MDVDSSGIGGKKGGKKGKKKGDGKGGRRGGKGENQSHNSVPTRTLFVSDQHESKRLDSLL